MNVFGKNERSWRKARKRGVSPIIATILLVAITVVLAAVLYVLITGLTGGGVGSKPIGSAFTVGPNPSSGPAICGAASTFAGKGCLTADYVYTLTIESSSVNFGNVLFQVKTATGAIYPITGPGGFSVMNTANVVAAQVGIATTTGMSMSSAGFAYSGTTGTCGITNVLCSASTTLTNLYTIVIDMGTANPAGQGLTFTALGAGGYTGTTGTVTLS